jgi:uncharacterized membrane protein YdjX (TVP38/TMEM64 family)
LIIDVMFRRAGESGLAKHLPPKRLEYLKAKVDKNAAWGLVVACLAPPPFPFTPFIMAASALQYPRKKMMAIVAAARFARYAIIGALAIAFGRRILRWAENDVVQAVIIGLVVISIVGSVISVLRWIKPSRKAAGGPSGPREGLKPVSLH